MMLIENLINRGKAPVLEKVLSFTEARHEMLVNNVANFDTVGYKMQDLPMDEFFGSLQKAVDRRASGGSGSRLQMVNTRHLQWDREGHLRAKPMELGDNNILFHDGNNRFVEKQMSEMAKNALLHNVAAELLRLQYSALQMAIKGRL